MILFINICKYIYLNPNQYDHITFNTAPHRETCYPTILCLAAPREPLRLPGTAHGAELNS